MKYRTGGTCSFGRLLVFAAFNLIRPGQQLILAVFLETSSIGFVFFFSLIYTADAGFYWTPADATQLTGRGHENFPLIREHKKEGEGADSNKKEGDRMV